MKTQKSLIYVVTTMDDNYKNASETYYHSLDNARQSLLDRGFTRDKDSTLTASEKESYRNHGNEFFAPKIAFIGNLKIED